MTASALNIASIVPTCQPGAAGGANAQAAGGLAGFEALLGALFPQADTTAGIAGAPLAATTATGKAAPAGAEALVAGLADAKDNSKTDAETEVAVDAAATAGQPTAGDAAAALVASLMATQTAPVQVQMTVAKDQAGQAPAESAAPTAPMAGGREKTKSMPGILGAAPKAGFVEQATLAPQADAAEPALAEADTPLPIMSEPVAVAPQPARNIAQAPVAPAATAPAAAVPTAAAQPMAALELPAEAIAAAAAAAETAPEPVAQTEAQAATAAATLTPPPAAPVSAPATRTAKTERAKAADTMSAEVSDEPKPLDAAAAPVVAKSAQGAAKVASATVEPTEAKVEEVEVAPESPDAIPQGETLAAEQNAVPASASTGQVVRGSPETVANMAAQIIKKLEGKTTRFDIELNPHGLGKVDVRIEIGAHGRVTAGMTFDNPQAAADVKARAAELQQTLERAGFDMSGGLSFDVASDRGQQQQQNQAWQDQTEMGRAFQGRAFRAALDTADAADTPNQGALRLRRGVSAGLDVRI